MAFRFNNKVKTNKDDILIAIMGPTGSGKSNFIDVLVGQKGKRAGSKLLSCTNEVSSVRIPGHPVYGDRLVVVDTPGFDDTNKSDMAILQMINKWLEETYKKQVQLTGIIYLHRITDNRMSGSPHRNLRMFGKMCGDLAAKNVVLVTTMWDNVKSGDVAKKREDELKNNFWRVMTENGASMARFENTPASSWRIVVDMIERRNDREILLLQEEIVDLMKPLKETEAGKTLYSNLQELLAKQKDTLRQLADHARNQKDAKLSADLEKEYKQILNQFESTFEAVATLKIPLGRRIQLFFTSKKGHVRVLNAA